MSWYYFAIISPMLWAVSNHARKYVLDSYFQNSNILVVSVFSAVSIIPTLVVFGLIDPSVFAIGYDNILKLVSLGFLYVVCFYPYYLALRRGEASRIVPLFQLVPVATFVFGFFILGETISPRQFIGVATVVVGAFLISSSRNTNSSLRKIDTYSLLLMAITSVSVALYFVLFKKLAGDLGFWAVNFWQFAAWVPYGILLLLNKKIRKQSKKIYKQHGKKIFMADQIPVGVNSIALSIFNYAGQLAPIALVNTLLGFQPIFVLVLAVLGSKYFPNLLKEDTRPAVIKEKAVFIALLVAGSYLIIF